MGLLKLLYYSIRAAIAQGFVQKSEDKLQILSNNPEINADLIREWEVKLQKRKRAKENWDSKIEKLKSR